MVKVLDPSTVAFCKYVKILRENSTIFNFFIITLTVNQYEVCWAENWVFWQWPHFKESDRFIKPL